MHVKAMHQDVNTTYPPCPSSGSLPAQDPHHCPLLCGHAQEEALPPPVDFPPHPLCGGRHCSATGDQAHHQRGPRPVQVGGARRRHRVMRLVWFRRGLL